MRQLTKFERILRKSQKRGYASYAKSHRKEVNTQKSIIRLVSRKQLSF